MFQESIPTYICLSFVCKRYIYICGEMSVVLSVVLSQSVSHPFCYHFFCHDFLSLSLSLMLGCGVWLLSWLCEGYEGFLTLIAVPSPTRGHLFPSPRDYCATASYPITEFTQWVPGRLAQVCRQLLLHLHHHTGLEEQPEVLREERGTLGYYPYRRRTGEREKERERGRQKEA